MGFLKSKLFSEVIKVLILGAGGMIIYLAIDLRDNMKYKQPLIDSNQTVQIKQVSTRISTSDSLFAIKNANTQKRIDILNDMIVPRLDKILTNLAKHDIYFRVIKKHNKELDNYMELNNIANE